MSSQDDSDIKIFGKPSHEEETDELLALAEQFERQNSNGNLDKSKLLGVRLSDMSPDAVGSDMDFSALWVGRFLSPSVMYQIRVLILFAAQTTVSRLLDPSMLATSAKNAMYDELAEKSPVFYENISDGAAFTFYYLDAKKGGDVRERIGRRFAMLCGRENDEDFAALGSEIYSAAASKTEKIIAEYEFLQ